MRWRFAKRGTRAQRNVRPARSPMSRPRPLRWSIDQGKARIRYGNRPDNLSRLLRWQKAGSSHGGQRTVRVRMVLSRACVCWTHRLTAINMLVRADEADKLIRRFLVAREFPNEFDQGMYKGQQGANGFLSK